MRHQDRGRALGHRGEGIVGPVKARQTQMLARALTVKPHQPESVAPMPDLHRPVGEVVDTAPLKRLGNGVAGEIGLPRQVAIPPVVIAQHRRDAKGRPQMAQPFDDRGRRNRAARQVAVHQEIARQQDEVGAQRIDRRDDPFDTGQRRPGDADMQVRNHGDGQVGQMPAFMRDLMGGQARKAQHRSGRGMAAKARRRRHRGGRTSTRPDAVNCQTAPSSITTTLNGRP